MKILVVGGGIIGLAVAEALAHRGVSVELFERNAEVGREASQVAAGILSPPAEAQGPGPFFDLLLKGFALLPETVARLQALTGVDLQYRAGGLLGLAISDEEEADLHRRFLWQSAAGLQVERVNREQIRQSEPAIDGAVRWGVWWPTTAQINTPRLVEAYRKRLQQAGGVIRTGQPVRRFLLEKDRVVGVETSAGSVRSDGVVNCAGPWAGFDAACPLTIPAIPVKGQVVELETRKPILRSVVKCSKSYLVQRDPARLLAGTTVEYVGFDRTVTPESSRAIRERVRQMVSGTSDLPAVGAAAALRPGTPDHLPILGATPLPGLWMATGHFRNGILLAPLTGRILADLILKETCGVDLAPFRLERFLRHNPTADVAIPREPGCG